MRPDTLICDLFSGWGDSATCVLQRIWHRVCPMRKCLKCATKSIHACVIHISHIPVCRQLGRKYDGIFSC